ncbi:helix-turn-helix domain-containing protein, partial [Erythrobacter sp.]|uniref:helix-turn-helix domain-containing protein n=1 Tax=Erythrobacter sp. TaxID=1042 RepID=UPI0031201149
KEGWANADAKLRLILAAEELIGDNGVARTSLREISRHAGHANVGAAQYHFGDKANLLAAVMQYRRPALDRQRQALFAERGYDMAKASVAQLISLINESLFDQSGENGVRSFARFLRGIELEDIFSQLWL